MGWLIWSSTLAADVRGTTRSGSSRLTIVAPSAAAVLLRGVQLALLVAISAREAGADRSYLIAVLGVLGATAIIADSGAGNYLLVQSRDRVTSSLVLRVARLHAAIAGVGGVAALGFCLASFGPPETVVVAAVVAGLAWTQVADSCVRVLRAPRLVAGDDAGFAAFDIAIALGKAPWLVAYIATGSLWWLVGLPMVSSAVVVGLGLSLLAGPGESRPSLRRRDVLLFGMNGAASSLYSQSPLLVSAAMLPLTDVVLLTLCYRLLQPLELVPATLAQQVLPRARRGKLSPGPVWLAFAGGGALLALSAVAARPVIEALLNANITPLAPFVIVAAATPLKFGNFALTAFAMARNAIRRKLLLTLMVGTVATLSALLICQFSPTPSAVAFVTLAAESGLAIGLIAILRSKKDVQ